MSAPTHLRRITPAGIRARKGGPPIVTLTAYTTPIARLLDPVCDILLVGDSLGMVLYGFETTLPVTLDMMIAHTAAVVRGSRKACVVIDLPFGSYQASAADAFRACARAMSETGCAAVKIEGGAELAETIKFLTERGVPVLGHVGLQPQSVHTQGGFRVQGRRVDERDKIIADAHAVAEAGAFAMVIEGVPESLARTITAEVDVPTIGIGASPACDGQVLVVDDMLGMISDVKPRFVKRYAELADTIAAAAAAYADDVRARRFPGVEHTYPETIEKTDPARKPA